MSEPNTRSVATTPPHEVGAAEDPAHDPRPLRRARRRSLALAVFLLVVAIALTVITAISPDNPATQSLDDAWARLVAGHRYRWLVDVSKALSVVGSAVVIWPARALAALVLSLRRRWLQLSAFAVAIGLSELCIGPIKAAIDRPRPSNSLIVTSAASFPSGHAVAAAVTAFGLVVAVLPRSRRRLRWLAGASSFAAAMALSRTYLAAHWLTDTVGGACLGVGLALGVEVVFEQFRTEVAEVVEFAEAVDESAVTPQQPRRPAR